MSDVSEGLLGKQSCGNLNDAAGDEDDDALQFECDIAVVESTAYSSSSSQLLSPRSASKLNSSPSISSSSSSLSPSEKMTASVSIEEVEAEELVLASELDLDIEAEQGALKIAPLAILEAVVIPARVDVCIASRKNVFIDPALLFIAVGSPGEVGVMMLQLGGVVSTTFVRDEVSVAAVRYWDGVCHHRVCVTESKGVYPYKYGMWKEKKGKGRVMMKIPEVSRLQETEYCTDFASRMWQKQASIQLTTHEVLTPLLVQGCSTGSALKLTLPSRGEPGLGSGAKEPRLPILGVLVVIPL